MRFEALSPEESGIDLINPLDPENPMSFLYHSGMSCGGVAIGDVDGDNRTDIYLTHGPGKNPLYRQAGDLTFEDVTDDSGTAGSGAWGTGVAMVDIDDDGDLDICACNYAAPNQLYVNSGTGHFTEEASAWGIDTIDASLMPTFCDYDLDGNLDFYLLTNRWHDPNSFPEESPVRVDQFGRPYILPELVKYYHLWQQRGKMEHATGRAALPIIPQ